MKDGVIYAIRGRKVIGRGVASDGQQTSGPEDKQENSRSGGAQGSLDT